MTLTAIRSSASEGLKIRYGKNLRTDFAMSKTDGF